MNDKPGTNEHVIDAPEWERSWSHDNAVRYYSSHRNTIGDVYDSEKFFLSRIIRDRQSVLDIGCATGGFYEVFKTYVPTITYTGIDISPEMIRQAKILHPEAMFQVTDGGRLPYGDDSFDMVFSAGALHMTPNWRDVLREGWRVTKKYFLFDVRIKESPPSIENAQVSYQKIEFSGRWDGKTIVPYIIIDIATFISELDALSPSPAVRQLHGYFHPVSDMVVSTENKVCMTMCCLIKHCPGSEKDLWDLPIAPM